MNVLQNIKIALGRYLTRRHHDNSDAARDSYVDLTRTLLKSALDNSQWEYEFDKEYDCFYSRFSVDDFYVILVLKPQANYIHSQIFAIERTVNTLKLADALLFCNGWNRKNLFPKAYINDENNSLIGEMIMNLGEEASEEFIRECYLKSLFASGTKFLKEAGKKDFLLKVVK